MTFGEEGIFSFPLYASCWKLIKRAFFLASSPSPSCNDKHGRRATCLPATMTKNKKHLQRLDCRLKAMQTPPIWPCVAGRVAAANSLDGPGKGEGPHAILFENPVWGSFTGFSIAERSLHLVRWHGLKSLCWGGRCF